MFHIIYQKSYQGYDWDTTLYEWIIIVSLEITISLTIIFLLVANKWIREGAQLFRKPCPANIKQKSGKKI